MNGEKKNLNNLASTLLQNMSCAPRSQIQYQSPHRRAQGRGIVFALRTGRGGLAALARKNRRGWGLGPLENWECQLRLRIDAHAQTLPLPAAAVVIPSAEPGDEECRDLLTIVTVLAKSSGHVYLRDKTPNLSQVKPGRRVVLLVPHERRG